MAILWNTSKVSKLFTKVGGVPFKWEPGEKKQVHIPAEIKHLQFKLEHKGLVVIPDGLQNLPKEEAEAKIKAFYLSGMKVRRKMLRDILAQFENSNNQRKAQQQAPMEPTEVEVAAVREIKVLDEEIQKLDLAPQEDRDMVKDYLGKEDVHQDIKDVKQGITMSTTESPTLTKPEPEQEGKEVEEQADQGVAEEA